MDATLALLALFIFCILILPNNSDAKTSNGGFSVDLSHRDSPSSPLYNPLATLADRARHAAHRSHSRLRYFQSSMTAALRNDIQSLVTPGDGEYLMNFSLGSPPLPILAIVDTGSDLIWTQCLPCENCYQQTTPIFDPAQSSTYTNLSCSTSLCQALGTTGSCLDSCLYSYPYLDESHTKGVLATETLTFNSSNGGTISIPNIGFGCGHDNGDNFEGAGLVGLGGGPLSLISQLGPYADYKFSYCFVPLSDNKSTSLMNFGDRAVVSGRSAVSTPLIRVAGLEIFYFLNLEDISVGFQKLNIPPGTFDLTPSGEGGFFIDSGTTFTFLHTLGYAMLELVMKSTINLQQTSNSDFNLCYEIPDDGSVTGIPDVTFHFSGADVLLRPLNTFVEVEMGVICLAIFPDQYRNYSIFGVVAQQNFHIGYDLVRKKVSFAPADCTASIATSPHSEFLSLLLFFVFFIVQYLVSNGYV